MGRCGVGARVGQCAIEGRGTRGPEGGLRHAELVGHGGAPFCRLLFHDDLLVGVVELDGELGGEDWLWRGRDAAILAYLFLRERWMRPSWLGENLPV